MIPGFYWARFKDHGWWQVVQVYSTLQDSHLEGATCVDITGSNRGFTIDDFEWGPKLKPPEGE